MEPYVESMGTKVDENIITLEIYVEQGNTIKYLFSSFFGGPYIKSMGTGGTKMSANAGVITLETYVQPGEQKLKTIFSYMSQNVKKKSTIFDYLRGPGCLQRSNWAYLASQLSFHPYLCTCEIRKQSDKNFLCSNKKYEKNNLFIYLGGPRGPLRRTT